VPKFQWKPIVYKHKKRPKMNNEKKKKQIRKNERKEPVAVKKQQLEQDKRLS
jgi:hypothetical protein